jgi:hypothetical protein
MKQPEQNLKGSLRLLHRFSSHGQSFFTALNILLGVLGGVGG